MQNAIDNEVVLDDLPEWAELTYAAAAGASREGAEAVLMDLDLPVLPPFMADFFDQETRQAAGLAEGEVAS